MFDPSEDPIPQVVYHGTDSDAGTDISRNGINLEKCTKGYFGLGFYAACDKALAKSNYADFAEGEEGVVLSLQIHEGAKILDLRNEFDFKTYAELTKNGAYQFRDDFAQFMQANGIDGLYDNSFEGVVFYNPRIITVSYAQELSDTEILPEIARPKG